MRMRPLLLALAVIALVGAAYGQGVIGGFVSGSFDTGAQGAPYSADVVNETTRTLADGNRIHQETHGKVYRDSQGRTRREIELAPPFPGSEHLRHIIITDPVQRTTTILDPRTKTARVHRFPGISTPTSEGMTSIAPLPTRRHITPPRSEQLGTKEIEGLTVTGTRHTRSIEAGEIGNDKPLVTVNETWYSPDLRTAILTLTDDPQFGHMATRLTNIQRDEPDPSLFQVPADYQVKEENRN